MTRVVPFIASFCLCAVTIAVAAPTLHDQHTVLQRASSAKGKVRSAGAPSKRTRYPVGVRQRRSKREVFVEEAPPSEDLLDAVSDELRGLSDEQLELLAAIVQNEINNYNPEQNLDDYEIVQVPIDFAALRNADLIDEFYPRDRRGARVVDDEEPPLLVFPEPLESEFDDEEPELVLIPQELAEAEDDLPELGDNAVDDAELRLRITELAELLNERAVRGL